MQRSNIKHSAALLLCMLPAINLHASNELSCTIDVLDQLGWKTVANSRISGLQNTDTCNADTIPAFHYNQATEDNDSLLSRSKDALYSVTSKCLFNRNYQSAVSASVKKLTDNTNFKFLPTGKDPRDPFLPPQGTWDTQSAKGYDIPLTSISSSVQALYEKPFVAECSAATQIAQLASLTEHFGTTTDAMIKLNEVGIGTWKNYAKIPSIAAKQSLFINRKARRKDGLATLAKHGHAAFYGQMGYIRPHKNINFIDSLDNLGQNYVIVDISERAVASIRAHRKPLKKMSRISINTWKNYSKRHKQGEPIELLQEQMQAELEATDLFFTDIEIYVHPLRTTNIAFHIARQFGYNPRTPYVFEVYEDYQTGFFYNRFIEHSMNACLSGNT